MKPKTSGTKRVRFERAWSKRNGEWMRREDADQYDSAQREAAYERRIDAAVERWEKENLDYPWDLDDSAHDRFTVEEDAYIRKVLTELALQMAQLPPYEPIDPTSLSPQQKGVVREACEWRDQLCPSAVPMGGRRRFWYAKRLAGNGIALFNSIRFELQVFVDEPDPKTDPVAWVAYEVTRRQLMTHKPIESIFGCRA